MISRSEIENQPQRTQINTKRREFFQKLAVGSVVAGFFGTVAEMFAEQQGGGILTFDFRGNLIPIGVGFVLASASVLLGNRRTRTA